MCIISNTVIFTLDKYDEDSEWLDNILVKSNYVFYGIFTLEMIMKLIGLGFKNYFSDKYNSFDFIIVLTNSVDIALDTYYYF